MKILYNFYNNVDISLVFSRKHKIDIIKNTNINEKKIKIINNPVNVNLIKKLSRKKILDKYKKFFVKKTQQNLFMLDHCLIKKV